MATTKKKKEDTKDFKLKQKQKELDKLKLEAKQTGQPQKMSRWTEKDSKGEMRKKGVDGMTGAAITEKSAEKRAKARKAKDKKVKARSKRLKTKKK